MIDRNAKSLLDLVNQMLDLSKLESGLLQVNAKQGDILAYLRYRIEAFESYAAEKHIAIRFSSDQDEIIMDFDPERISHIVNNLVSNAIKFTGEHGQILVHANRIDGGNEGQRLELKVSDTGIGIPPEKVKHIFDRFYQVDDTTIRRGEGTGIGLSLVNEMVKLLGGSIEVESTLGEGTEFRVLLPLVTTIRDILQDEKDKDISKDDELLAGSPGTEKEELPVVLIVEDNADVSHYVRVSIENSYRIATAPDGRKGVSMAIELIPDVIISDVMMPAMDGYELCQAVKQDERTSHIPVILLTAKSDHKSKVEGLEHGADAYLTKPFDQKELLIRLRNLLALRAEFQKRYSNLDDLEHNGAPANSEDAFVLKLRSSIIDHLEDEDFSVVTLCQLVHVSRAQLHRKLVALTGSSTSHFIRKIQLEVAEKLLREEQLTVSEVAYKSGFKTQAHFSRVFGEKYGIPPSEFARKV